MSQLIRVDDGGGAKRAVVAIPEWVQGRVTVWADMLPTTGKMLVPDEAGDLVEKRALKPYRQVRINDLSPLADETHLRRFLMDAARKFEADMEREGKHPLTAEADWYVTGPFPHREVSLSAAKPVLGNEGERPGFGVIGQRADENPWPDKADFVIQAQFLKTRIPVPDEATMAKVAALKNKEAQAA